MKILILGSEGQIGKPVTQYLRVMGHTVSEWDKKLSHMHDLSDDYCSNFLRDAINEVDFVYYFASDVGGSKYLEKNEHSANFILNNILIMNITFSALQKCKKPFIFTSSQMAELSYSTYGQLKLIGEKLTNSLGGLVVRLWNVYGKEHDMEKSHVITDFIHMALNDNVINMRTNGAESRQLLFTEDCAKCLLSLTEQYDKLDKNKNYHITSFKWNTVLEIAEIIQKITGCKIEKGIALDQTQKNAMNDPDKYILNFWMPTTSLEQGIIRMINDIKK